MPAADGVDARARRVAARLLSSRGWRASQRSARPEDQRLDARPDQRLDAPAARRAVGGHPARAARVARTLQTLEGEGWVSLGRVNRPGGGRRLIDHVVIGPGGVVVVDSHAWVGRIEVTRGVVQQNGFWREAETAEVARAAGSIAALLLPQHRTAVHALICVAQHDLPHHVVAPGVHVVGVTELCRALRGLPQRLHPTEILQLYTQLRHTLADSAPPEQLTTAEFDLLPRPDDPGWVADGEPRTPGQGLFVPVDGRALRKAARTASRGRRPSRLWRAPGWRLFLARILLAALVVIGAVLLGPTVLHGGGEDVPPVPPVTPASPGGSVVPAPYTPPPSMPPDAVTEIADAGDADLAGATAQGPTGRHAVLPAVTARDGHRRSST